MAPPTILFLLIASFFLAPPPHLQVQAADQAFTSVVISQKGLDFLKDLLVTQAVSSIIPLQLPKISKSKRIPFLGNVNMVLSNITIYGIDVGPSHFELGDDGIAIIASGVTCNLSMNWHYSYSTWIAPVVVSDEGRASIQVEGLEVGLSLGLGIEEGTLKLTLNDCGCYVKEISIKLDGGASWLYQGMIDAFEEQIGSAVETSMTKELKDGVLKLDSFMQALPKEVPLDDNTALNMTFVNDPVLSNSSIGFEINGLFGRRNASVSEYHNKDSLSEYRNKDAQPLVSCSDPSKMLGISLDEAVFNSVAAAYFNAEFMQWIVDKIPDQSFLNTAGWRFIIPQLYKKYPNHDMDLNISLYSPPVVRISEHNIDATIYSDLIIDVLEEDRVIPVACISLVIRGSGSVKISGNNLAGSVKLNDFSMSLKWSNIGNLRLYLVQPVMWTIIQTVFLPYVNSHLGKGFPLPIVHGFTLQNAELVCSSSRVMVCSDVIYEASHSHNLNWLLHSIV
ncbi:putative BPI/LBP family protein At1g04970 [Pyrus x bretschneideri]|uniref:putative BPI/LBP family protein At1g04970 n=1 Tax=Pyrus x bretschneideri TaxID=225117 RepID=UPI0020309419|nr:putative BPI/LBP family protein At1g04970 [Pyrus x bretschneideri]